TILHAQLGFLREQVLRAADRSFGHRLMMDRVIPGGVHGDLTAEGIDALRQLLVLVRRQFPDLVEVYDNTESLKDRTVSTGIVTPALVEQFGAGGYVGRASGRSFDARRTPGYAPYDRLQFEVPVVQAGDVNARVWIRIREVGQSVAIIEQIIAALPAGAVHAPASANAGEAWALVEGFRGDIFVWL